MDWLSKKTNIPKKPIPTTCYYASTTSTRSAFTWQLPFWVTGTPEVTTPSGNAADDGDDDDDDDDDDRIVQIANPCSPEGGCDLAGSPVAKGIRCLSSDKRV